MKAAPKQQVEPVQAGDKKKKPSKPEVAAPAVPTKAQQPAAKANSNASSKKPSTAVVTADVKPTPAVNAENDVVVDQEDDGQWVTQGGKQVRHEEELSLFLTPFDRSGQQSSTQQRQSRCTGCAEPRNVTGTEEGPGREAFGPCRSRGEQ